MAAPYNPIATIVKAGLLRVWPDECLACKREGAWLCDDCHSRLVPIYSPTCPFCRRLSAGGKTCPRCRAKCRLNGCISLFGYSRPLSTLVAAIKYRQYTAGIEWAAPQLAAAVGRLNPRPKIITSVPSAAANLAKRGFNQSELMAKSVSRATGIAYQRTTVRSAALPSQVGLTRAQRFLNVADQFSCLRRLNGESIAVIDDVITTGATLNACAAALKAAGAKAVWGVTLAKD